MREVFIKLHTVDEELTKNVKSWRELFPQDKITLITPHNKKPNFFREVSQIVDQLVFDTKRENLP